METNLTPKQVKTIETVRLLLDSMDAQLRQDKPIVENTRILAAIQVLELNFSTELCIGA